MYTTLMRMFRSYRSLRQDGYCDNICERQHTRTNVARSQIPAHGSRTEGPAIFAERGRSSRGAGRLSQGVSCLRWSGSWHLDVSEVGGGTEKDDGESSWGAGYGRLLNGLLTCMSCPLVTLFFYRVDRRRLSAGFCSIDCTYRGREGPVRLPHKRWVDCRG